MIIASLVERVTPPKWPPVGDGRIKAFMSRDNSCILVLSPINDPSKTMSIIIKNLIFYNFFIYTNLPPLVVDDGSTASTAIFSPLPVKNFPKLSKKVDFPAPGGPDKP